MFKKMPFILLFIIALVAIFNAYLPLHIQQAGYALSLTIKSLILFVLPFIIFSLLFKAAVHLAKSATKILIAILVSICCSNFIATYLSHYVGRAFYWLEWSMSKPVTENGLTPLWDLTLPSLIPNHYAMLLGVIAGMGGVHFFKHRAEIAAGMAERFVGRLLRVILFAIPLFVAGFVMKLQHDGTLSIIIKDYTLVFLLVAASQLSYLAFLYFALNQFSVKRFAHAINNMLPAALSGITTMSSAVSMPLTLIGAAKNTKQRDIAQSVIPMTVNVHLIGDCIAIPIFAYAIMKSFGFAEPTFLQYFIFVIYFVIAKFGVAAIPGGGIVVMLPILHSELHFNSDMLSLITALYILFDPLITAVNILGNGAFAQFIDKLFTHRRL